MVIRIFKNGETIRYIEIDEESALPLFNMIIQSLGYQESVILYTGDEERIIATVV
nr:MAG TPA: hypothetical protein [Caudoviricetes sp.]